MASTGKEMTPIQMFDDIEVIGLIGPSGTGKSHHAMGVAQEHDCDAIVDDGLLIVGSRIVAGRSAKREETKLAAVRRAVFTSPSHAVEVRGAIAEFRPKRILVLGTSLSMVERIVERLGLPYPSEILDIRDLKSEEEVTEALRHRKQEGKHVIPAPTFEVKKTFSGYLVDPLQIFVRSREEKPAIVERSVVRPTYSYFGNFYIADNVVMHIASEICYEFPEVRKVLRTLVINTSGGANLQVELALAYGVDVFSVMKQVQTKLKEKVEYLTGIYLVSVDVVTRKISLE
ncbi:MAG: Asp23/Gls24 family envelope stress response protein [Bacillota bacterium]